MTDTTLPTTPRAALIEFAGYLTEHGHPAMTMPPSVFAALARERAERYPADEDDLPSQQDVEAAVLTLIAGAVEAAVPGASPGRHEEVVRRISDMPEMEDPLAILRLVVRRLPDRPEGE